MSYWKGVWALLRKDLILELRTREMLTSMGIFSLLVLLIFNFMTEPGTPLSNQMAPAILWIAFTFAGVLGLNRSFFLEKEKECLQGLLLCPIDRSALFLGKFLGNMLFILAIEAITLVFFSILFNKPVFRTIDQLGVLILLGDIGFASVGTLFSAISLNTKAREVMLPLLLFSIIIPVIIVATKLTGRILQVCTWSDLWSGLKILISFDAIFLTLSILTFEHTLEE